MIGLEAISSCTNYQIVANLSDMKMHQIYFGKKFYQRKDGYWACTTNGSLLAHRWVWIVYFGEIPPNMDIHHMDDDQSNNDISNLLMLTPSQHLKFHWRMRKHDPNQLLLAI